ncbi:MAG: hypothetical protein HN617_04990 [Planctomycetaceae bacterium]|jgi:hypothetical protein|nr:hypothetical protein [Planctomycetaceae bacterium]MBT4012775.1 hypothetical protein [Planctomycetaceae bacterium]MBT4725104.1 hypothetical protein [Planctomycetaceae bacterium]MBT4844677.1 hypothetical protein [Planctomycetaceae bacterium]MBT5124044.1 hypothetical protein [Planctomycetaceae bacterium]
MPRAGTKLAVSTLTKFLRANLILADIEPIFGTHTEITRFALNPDSVQLGDTYIHCCENYSLLKDSMLAYENGANGIICASHIPPLAGSFVIQVQSVESMINLLYPYMQRCLIDDSVETANLLLRSPRVA